MSLSTQSNISKPKTARKQSQRYQKKGRMQTSNCSNAVRRQLRWTSSKQKCTKNEHDTIKKSTSQTTKWNASHFQRSYSGKSLKLKPPPGLTACQNLTWFTFSAILTGNFSLPLLSRLLLRCSGRAEGTQSMQMLMFHNESCAHIRSEPSLLQSTAGCSHLTVTQQAVLLIATGARRPRTEFKLGVCKL